MRCHRDRLLTFLALIRLDLAQHCSKLMSGLPQEQKSLITRLNHFGVIADCVKLEWTVIS